MPYDPAIAHALDFSYLGKVINQYHPEFDPNSLNPTEDETYDQWRQRIAALTTKYPDAADNLNALIQVTPLKNPGAGPTPNAKRLMDLFDAKNRTDRTGKQTGMSGAAGQGPVDRNKAIDDFYRMMMDPNAPELQAAQRQSEAGMARAVRGQGVAGGRGAYATARAGIEARNGLQFQRQQAGINALQYGMQHDLSKSGQTFDQNQSNQLNSQAQTNGYIQGGIAAAGQLGSAALQAYGANQAAQGGGVSSYGGMGGAASPYGGGGYGSDWTNYGGSSPDEWSNPYGGY